MSSMNTTALFIDAMTTTRWFSSAEFEKRNRGQARIKKKLAHRSWQLKCDSQQSFGIGFGCVL